MLLIMQGIVLTSMVSRSIALILCANLISRWIYLVISI